jgi:hypothetical protein
MIKIKVNKNLGVNNKGDIVSLEALTPFWRRRLKDAEVDYNCEILLIEREKKVKTESKSGDKK